MADITYYYNRLNKDKINNETLPPYMARHHLISYPFMHSFAIVLLWYIANDSNYQQMERLNKFFISHGQSNWKDRIKIFAGNNKGCNYDGGNSDVNNCIREICWAPANLFIGPSGEYREDDPSQKMEELPNSFPDKQKELAGNTIAKWNTISKSRIVGRDGAKISIQIENTRSLSEFINAFVNYITCSENVYKTCYNDWVVVSSQNKKYSFWVEENMSKKKIEDVPDKFKFCLRKDEPMPKQNEVIVRVTDFTENSNGHKCAQGVFRKYSNGKEALKKLKENNWYMN